MAMATLYCLVQSRRQDVSKMPQKCRRRAEPLRSAAAARQKLTAAWRRRRTRLVSHCLRNFVGGNKYQFQL